MTLHNSLTTSKSTPIRSAFLHMHKTQHYELTLFKASITVQQSRYYKLTSHFDITKSYVQH